MTRGRRWLVAFGAMLVAALPLLPHGTAEAHPLGNFTINRYARLELYAGTVRVHYVLDYAEIPTVQLLPDLDADGDGRYSDTEVARYADALREPLAREMELRAGGERLPLRAVESAGALAEGQAGLQTLRVTVVYEAAAAATGKVALTYVDHNFQDRAGWKEIVVRPSQGTEVVGLAAALLTDASAALTAYPAEDLRSAPDVRRAEFTWNTASGEAAPAAAALEAGTAKRAAGGFAALVDNDESALIILLALLAAFGFGALHALGPGHGKTVVAAYLVGSKGTVRHAVALGLTVTATHTASVYVLGFATLALSAYVVPETLYLYLGVASGALVVVMGLALFAGRVRGALRRTAADDGAHRHGLFGRSHSHLPAAHEHDHAHEHGHDGHPHPHPHDHGTPAKVTWRGLFTLGVAGGLLPCPSAIVVMLAAISLGKVAFGMLLIVAFSPGLAGVLTAIGVGLVLGRRLAGRTRLSRVAAHPAAARLAGALALVSALGVTVAGVGITYLALQPV
ncbi:MAG TPA: hypothetical protein PKA49_05570 [Tepidiformaceae bacterium]|nr:hypothetical protein [Tepidiformaceae bacterium]